MPSASDRLGVLALQQQHLAEPLLRVRARVDERRVAVTGPARTRKQLMRPVNGSAIVLKMKTACFASPNSIVVPLRRRRRDALDEQVEQRGRAEVLRRDAAADGIELVAGHRVPSARAATASAVELLALEVARHQLLVGLDDRVEQLLAVLLHERRPCDSGIGCGPPSFPPDGIHVRAHVEEVDDAGQLVLGADRKLDRDAAVGELRARRLEHAEEVGALAVEHVDEENARELVLLGALPDARTC